MKSKKMTNEFSRMQPWRVELRHKESLQSVLALAFGATSLRAKSHVEKVLKDFEIVSIMAITRENTVALACFSEVYANLLIEPKEIDSHAD